MEEIPNSPINYLQKLQQIQRIVSHFSSHFSNFESPEDLAQDIFLELWQNPKFQLSDPPPFLLIKARVVDRARRKRIEDEETKAKVQASLQNPHVRTRLANFSTNQSGVGTNPLPTPSLPPELLTSLETFLSSLHLSLLHSSILYLKFWQGQTLPEISKELGIELNVVKRELQKIFLLLREEIRGTELWIQMQKKFQQKPQIIPQSF